MEDAEDAAPLTSGFLPSQGICVLSSQRAPRALSPPQYLQVLAGVLETDSFSGKGKSSSDKTDLQHVAGQVPGISSAPPGSQTCLSLPQAGGQGDRTHPPLEDRPQTVGALRASSQNTSLALKDGKEAGLCTAEAAASSGSLVPGAGKSSRACMQACHPVLRHSAPQPPPGWQRQVLRPHEKHNGNTSLRGR